MSSAARVAAWRYLTDFRLTDQRGREHRRGDYHGVVVVLVASDWAGSRYVRGWLKAIWGQLAGVPGLERVRALGVADARGLPRMLRSTLVAVLPKRDGVTVLLDWDGAIATAHALTPGECNVMVVDATGRVVHRMSGRGVDPAEVVRIAARIRETALDHPCTAGDGEHRTGHATGDR
jgi:hypothetical protein